MTEIDPRIFRDRVFTGTPATVSAAVRTFCRGISPAHDPVYVDCRPEGSAGECFFNVRSKVERDGGELLHGWAIWEWTPVMIEAEHHAVWRSGGASIDVTPNLPPCDRVLFLPDPERTFDFATLRRVQNIRRSFGAIPEAEAFIDASQRLYDFQEAHSDGRRIAMPRDQFEALYGAARQAQGAVLDRLARRKGPNDPCICRSGRKFKRCCRPFIRLG